MRSGTPTPTVPRGCMRRRGCLRCGPTTIIRSSRGPAITGSSSGAADADDADTDPRVAEAVDALNIRYVLTSTPVVRGFVMPDGLVSLESSRSWEKI
jgi:hypothetical protein